MVKRKKVRRAMLLLLCLFSHTAIQAKAAVAASGCPIEMRADRMVIYPDRLELQGEETLMDVLMMCPDLMQSGFENRLESYSLRLDNVEVEADPRIFLTHLKARHIEKIQFCDNTGVAKGSTGLNRVIDISLLRTDDGMHGDVEAGIGTDHTAEGSTEIRYGGKNTNVYATATYAYADQDNTIGQKEQLFTRMANWLSPRDLLRIFFSQQYLDNKIYTPGSTAASSYGGALHKVGTNQQSYLIQESYFHTFNDIGTELLIESRYNYTNVPKVKITPESQTVLTTAQDFLFTCLELNTPLGRHLDMMLGWEGDFSYNTLRMGASGEQKYMQSNNDLYLQLNYRTGALLLTLGNRVMFYHYSIGGISKNDTRNNLEASIVATLSNSSQTQLAYHRKFSNPSFSFDDKTSEEEWALRKGNLKAQYIDEVKLAYNYCVPSFTWTAASYLLNMQGADNIWKLQTAAYYKTGPLAVNAGINYYNVKGQGNDFATFHIAPRLSLPWQLQVGAQAILATDNASLAHTSDTYVALQASKLLGKHLRIGIDWHDISSSHYSACLATLQYRF